MPALPPPHPVPLGCFPDFYARQAEGLLIREHALSFSGDDFTITTANGQPILRVNGKAMSFAGRKDFHAINGALVYTLRKQHVALLPQYFAKVSDGGERLFTVKSKFKMLGSKAECTFRNAATGTEETLVMSGGWSDRSAEIVHQGSGMVVATIQRQFLNARELLGNAQTYQVMVAQNVDLALIAGLCVCLDEARNDQK